MTDKSASNGDLSFTAELFKAADKLRGNLEPSEYKHVALGLIFLKYFPMPSRRSMRSLRQTNTPTRRIRKNI